MSCHRNNCLSGHYKPDNTSSDCQPCRPGTCTAKEGQRSCDPCPEDAACARGCTSPRKCSSWAEHVAVNNSRCHWSTAFYVTISVIAGSQNYSCLSDSCSVMLVCQTCDEEVICLTSGSAAVKYLDGWLFADR